MKVIKFEVFTQIRWLCGRLVARQAEGGWASDGLWRAVGSLPGMAGHGCAGCGSHPRV